MIAIDKRRLTLIQLAIIAFVWFLLLAVPVLFGNLSGDINWNHILKIWTEYAFLFVLFLINRFILLPYLFFRGKRAGYFIALAALLLMFFANMYIRRDTKRDYPPPEHMQGIHPREMHRPPPRPRAPREPIPPYANLLILSVLLLGFDSGLNISIKWVQSEQKRIQLEKENTDNKLTFLHNQISPHFFMNTLNNIHALVDIDTEETKESIIKLSRLMSYLLYETQIEIIPLEKEIQFIRSYVELMQLRFSDKVKIHLQIPESLPRISIPPLLFVSFIENAFKYGISYQKPSNIDIDISFPEKSLQFSISNSNHPQSDDKESPGIGIENTRSRLDLLYGNSYSLEINNLPESFTVNLSIPV